MDKTNGENEPQKAVGKEQVNEPQEAMGKQQVNESQKSMEKQQINEDKIEEIIDNSTQDDKKHTYILYRTINNYGVMAGDDAKFENIHIKDTDNQKGHQDSVFIMDDKERLSSWLGENYESHSMALIVSAAVFDSMPYIWVVRAADLLFNLFDKKENEEKKSYGITDTLNRFGAEICQGEMNTYTGKTNVEVVHLLDEGYKERILKYIWRECPQLQETIILWLQKYSIREPVSMSRRAIEVIGLFVCWDYYFFLNNMVSKIHKDDNIYTDMLIAQIVITLNEEEIYKDNVHNLLKVWSNENRVHYLLTGLFVCVVLKDKNDILENMVGHYVHKVMEEIRNNGTKKYLPYLFDFFAVGMRAFTFYRILIEKICEPVYEQCSLREKKHLSNLFLRLFNRYKFGTV